jgi:hypothetical protein
MNVLSDPTQLVLAQAAAQVPGGPVSVRTTLGWVQRGVGGVKLEAFRRGHKWRTSREAVERFLAALNREPAGVA